MDDYFIGLAILGSALIVSASLDRVADAILKLVSIQCF